MRIAVIDVGGTSIKSGLWENGRVTQIRETDTNAILGNAHVMRTIPGILAGYRDFQAVGISTAGQVDSSSGTILYANKNISGYMGTRIKEIVEKRFHVFGAVQNDVNSAAVGEAYCGDGKGHRDFFCLTYGTGVGGAIIMNGEIYGGIGLLPEKRAHDLCADG